MARTKPPLNKHAVGGSIVSVSKNKRPENTPKQFCVASAAVRNETGNFTTEQRLKARPHRACLKAFL